MAYLGNTPGSATIIQVEARKSFALGLWVKEPGGKPVDLAGCTLTIVAKKPDDTTTSDATNILSPNDVANISSPAAGYARFELQANVLNQSPGEYPYAIVLRTADGYSSVIVKGILDIQPNTEYASVGSLYSGVNPPQSLNVLLREANSINVFVGGQLPPGMNYVTDEVVETITSFDPDSVAMVPTGGISGYVLTKTSTGDYSMAWLPVGNGAFALDATGLPAGMVPASVGDDTWIWAAVGLDAAGAPDGYAPVANGDGTWTWAAVSTTVDWSLTSGVPGSILNKPTLGTAAAADTDDFLPSTTSIDDLTGVALPAQLPLVSAMPGIHLQTTVPTTGEEGHLYFVYTP